MEDRVKRLRLSLMNGAGRTALRLCMVDQMRRAIADKIAGAA